MRTHHLGELRKTHIGESVKLTGWVNRRRDHGGLIFIDLRDRFGITQIVFDPEKNAEMHALAEDLRSEFVILIKGKVIPRAEGMANPNMITGDIEVEVNTIDILSKAKTPPFSVCDDQINVGDDLRLKYRYLDMRRGKLMNNLIMRHKTMQAVRNFLTNENFIEVTTPILTKSTPEGARDYVVPSRVHPGDFYALPQSPQLFKQILMVGGLDRYFQIATCFRDEDLRADRQPEFSQIDIEMSFSTREELFALMEGMFKEVTETDVPFTRIPYDECMEKYGCDKPDLRYDMQLIRINQIAERSDFSAIKNAPCIKGLCVKGGADTPRRVIDNYTTFVGQFGAKGLAWMKRGEDGLLSSSIVKFFSDELQKELIETMKCEPGDLLLFVADEERCVNQSLDHLRRHIAAERNLIDPKKFSFLWVVDFPLFVWNPDEERMETEHHPFTQPLEKDIPLLDTDPLKVRSSSYDLVLNGYEIASGSQRIHNPDLQKKIFETLKLPAEEIEKRFGFFVEALQYGTPPHLGIGIGFDRLLMIMAHAESIREVIAFPKTQRASDLMMQCPDPVSEEQMAEIHLKHK